jgi:hypothetical protein
VRENHPIPSIIGLADELAAAAGRLDPPATPVTIRPPAASLTIRTTGRREAGCQGRRPP